MFSIFARVNNLFDEDYESFGLLGEPDEVPGFGGFTNNRFVGVGAPISGFVGISATF
jgi:outer membrane receptor protein involved in Fe transport